MAAQSSDADNPPKRRPPHTWLQRLTVVGLVLTAFGCLLAALSLGTAQWVLANRQLVDISNDVTSTDTLQGAPAPVLVTPEGVVATKKSVPEFKLAEPAATNFLVVGADDCADESDPVMADRGSLGERSDTIMIWRANPEANQLAVLSFPRDLYVNLPGGRKGRINEAFIRDDPKRLIETIDQNFGVPVDHYLQVDFCAFRELVDAIGGVGVPFEYPARDKESGLYILDQTGCVTLDGNTALAYVRSRHYYYQEPDGTWREDPSSDFGRIARQQDFLRRVVAKVINNGLYSPDVASAMITTNRKYLVYDSGLTAQKMLEFANTLRSLDPGSIQTYRIESYGKTVGSAEVEIPRTKSENMQAILAVFRGEALLADAPDQIIGEPTTLPRLTTTTTTTTLASTGNNSSSGSGSTRTSTTTSTTTTSTLPVVTAESNTTGYVPDPNIVCP